MDLLEQVQRDQRAGAPILHGQAGRVGVFQPGEEEAAERYYCHLSLSKGGLHQRGGKSF